MTCEQYLNESSTPTLIAELISAGTELLLGEIVDTNAVYLSKQLARIGVDVYYRHTVGDNLGRLAEILKLALQRSDVIIITGGLGPTQDDITREAIAKASARVLVRSDQAVEELQAFFAERGRIPTPNNLRQADAPEGAVLITNHCGTAPGIRLEHGRSVIFALPGPPVELQPMFTQAVLPYLNEKLGNAEGRLFTRELLLADIGESNAADVLTDLIQTQTDPTIAMYASPAQVRIRIATKDVSEMVGRKRIAVVEAAIRILLGDHVFGVDDDTTEKVIGDLMRKQNATLTCAESCTGGLIASRITDVPGSSEYFLGGIVAYANEVKHALLGVPEEVLATHGAVSEQCAAAMAQGARTATHADFAVATTGIAGPGGGTSQKPVGLVYIAVADAAGTVVESHNWPGSREQFKHRTAQIALNMLRKRIAATH